MSSAATFKKMKGSAKKTAGGEHTCCTKKKVKRGPWSAKEDAKLKKYILENAGHGCWTSLPEHAGLKRCGKSCRLRWKNYLRPEVKHGNFSRNEARLIIQLQKIHGNKWADIARQLPGRTDNEIKNFWNSKVKKKKCRSNQNQTLSDDVLAYNDNAGNNYLQSGAGCLHQNIPTNSHILEQQKLYLNLFHMMKEKFFYPAVDMLMSGPTNDSLDMVRPPPVDSNDKGKGVVSLDMVPPAAADSIDKGNGVVSLDMMQPLAADSMDKGKEVVVDNEFLNVAQPFNGDGDFLGSSMDFFDDLLDMVQPLVTDSIDKGKGVVSLDIMQRPAADSIDKGMVSLYMVQPPTDSIDKGKEVVVDVPDEFSNVAQPFNGDEDFLGPSMDAFDGLLDMVQSLVAESIDKGKGAVSLDMVQRPVVDSNDKGMVSLYMVQPPADSIDKGKEVVFDVSDEFSNVAQPFNGNGDGDFLGPSMDVFDDLLDMVQPLVADSIDKGMGAVSLNMVQRPAADSFDKGMVSMDMVQHPADSLDKEKEVVVDVSNELSNVAQPFNGDGDFLGPSMDVFDDLLDMLQPPAPDSIDKGKRVVSLDMMQPPTADSIKGKEVVVDDSNEFSNVAQPFNGDGDFLGPSMDDFDDLLEDFFRIPMLG